MSEDVSNVLKESFNKKLADIVIDHSIARLDYISHFGYDGYSAVRIDEDCQVLLFCIKHLLSNYNPEHKVSSVDLIEYGLLLLAESLRSPSLLDTTLPIKKYFGSELEKFLGSWRK
jgi:hypothetical protein